MISIRFFRERTGKIKKQPVNTFGRYKTLQIFCSALNEFKIIKSLITNFHLPKSTLLMLISALYNREDILRVYDIAVKERYRFFSYGDAMFIE